MEMLIEIPGIHTTLNVTYNNDIVDLFVAQAWDSCSATEDCLEGDTLQSTISVQHVVADTSWNHAHLSPSRFQVSVQSVLPDVTALVQQQMSDQYSSEDIRASLALDPRLFRLIEYRVQYNANQHVLYRCGDSQIQSCATCDDGNTKSGDGCSSSCMIEAGFMCRNSRRQLQFPHELGTMVEWRTNATTNARYLDDLELNEACTGDLLCTQGDVWQREVWSPLYGGLDTAGYIVPPAGVYCADFCSATFLAPRHYEFAGDCQLTPINECQRGTSACHTSAVCIEPEDGVG